MAEHDESSKSEPKDTLEFPVEKAYFLQRIEILHELQKELLAWAKLRFWIVSLVVIFGASIGVYAFIKVTIREVVDREVEKLEQETREASKAAVLAEHSATMAMEATDKAQKQANAYTQTMEGLREKAKKVDQEFILIQQKLQAETGNVRASAQKDAKDLGNRLDRLENLVAGLAKQSDTTGKTLAKYEQESQRLEAARVSSLKRFAENSKYFVQLVFDATTDDLSSRITKLLSEKGFRVSSHNLPNRRIGLSNRGIQYSANAESKAEEIRKLIKPLFQFHQIEVRELKQFVMYSKGVNFILGQDRYVLIILTEET